MMYDRYDDTKGRYVNYDYQPKGDRFKRGLAVRPRVFTVYSNHNTGYSATRRVCTSRTTHLTISQLKSLLPKSLADTLEQLTLYFDDAQESLLVHFSEDKPGFPVRFAVTQQAKGKRHWFSCVGCGRNVGKLYIVSTQQGKVWGCQKCLGLTYPSQRMHKNPSRDMAIVEGKIKVSFQQYLAAHQRYEKRMLKWISKVDALSESLTKGKKRA